MRVNEFVAPRDEDLFSEEDIARVIDAEINGQWTTYTPEEMIAHIRSLFNGDSND